MCIRDSFGTGADETGNRAWIRFGSIGIQPAELGKVLFILTLSGHIYQLREDFHSLKSIVFLLVHAMIPVSYTHLDAIILQSGKPASSSILRAFCDK